MQNAIFYIANLFVQAGINSFDSVMVAGNSAASNADSLVYEMMNAVYIATSSFVGRSYGAKSKRDVRRSYLICQIYSCAVGTAVGLTLLVFGPQFLSLFTSDPAVIDAGMQKLAVMSLSYWISAFMDNVIAASRGIGKSVVPMIFIVIGSCILRIVWIFTVFAHFGTIASLYLLYPFSWSVTALMQIVYFIRCYRHMPDASDVRREPELSIV
jgi:Na+-driven multidrug efflux pump